MRALLRSIRNVWLFAMLVSIVLPVALGPATSTLTRTLGGEPEHTCMCGMKRGTCGCPSCEQAEAQRRDARHAPRYVAVRSTCEDDDGFVRAPSLPLATPNLVLADIASAPRTRVVPSPISELRSQLSLEPSTPPPRA